MSPNPQALPQKIAQLVAEYQAAANIPWNRGTGGDERLRRAFRQPSARSHGKNSRR